MGELDARELGKRRKKVAGQSGVGLGVELEVASALAAKLIDRVEAAPQNGVVLGESVVVELITGVGDPFSAPPTDTGHLLVTERLGDERVVVDRHHVAARLANEGRKDVGREGHPGCGHGAVGGVHADRVLDVFEPLNLGVLKDLHAQRLTGPLEAPHQAGGIHERVAIDVKERAFVGR